MSNEHYFPNNDHIIHFLDYYVDQKSPHYAVLLTGEWGIGKTFFIRDYMAHLEKKGSGNEGKKGLGKIIVKICDYMTRLVNKWKRNKGKKNLGKIIVKVSLNGVQTKGEIDNMLIKEFLPLLKNKFTHIGGKIAVTFGGWVKANLNHLKVSDFCDVYHQETIYVFDDLERCVMPVESTLGYINSFVEEEGCRVIIIGNEEEIRNAVNGQENSSYDRIKEKVIGKTLKVMPETENAFNYFLEQLNVPEIKDFLKSKKDIVTEIYRVSELNNLRILQQTISDFGRLYDCLEGKHKAHNSFMNDLVYIFFALSFEIKSGHVTCDDLEIVQKNYLFQGTENETENSEKTKYFDKYINFINIFLFGNTFFTKTLSYILEDGFISKEKIINELNSIYYFREPATWEKISRWTEQDPKEWESLLEEFEIEFRNRKYKDIEKILCIFDLKFSLIKNDIIKDDVFEVKSDCKSYVDYLCDNSSESLLSHEISSIGNDNDLLFCEEETEELKEYLIKKMLKIKIKNFTDSIKKRLFLDEGLTLEQIRQLDYFPFNDTTILDLFDVGFICKFIMDEPREEFYKIMSIVCTRNYSNSLSAKQRELENIKLIKDSLADIQVNLNDEKIKDRFMKEKIKYIIRYIDEWLVPKLS